MSQRALLISFLLLENLFADSHHACNILHCWGIYIVVQMGMLINNAIT